MKQKEITFLARYAHEEIRRRLANSISKDNVVDSFVGQGITIDYTLGLPGVMQLSVEVLERRKMHRGSHTTRSVYLPLKQPTWDVPVLPLTDGVEKDGSFETVLEIRYPYASETRVLKVDTSFSWAALEGRECSCCRLHKDVTHETDDCPIHGSSMYTHSL